MNKIINNPQIKKLLISHNIFLLGREILQVFMAIFIWKFTKNFSLIAIYYLTHLLAHSIGFTVFAYGAKLGRVMKGRFISLVGLIIGYFIIFLFREMAINYIWLIGLWVGFFNGAYWINYHVLKYDNTNTQNRGNYSGIEDALNIVVDLIGPILGGFLIIKNWHNFGYGSIFIIGGISYLLALAIGNFKPSSHPPEKLNLTSTIKAVWKNKKIKTVFLANFFGNLGYRGIMERIIPVLIFDKLQNEFHLGGWLTTFSLISIIITLLIGKYMPYKYYKHSLIIGGSMFFLSTLGLVGLPSLITYLIYGFAQAGILPLTAIPADVYAINSLHHLDDYIKHRVEYIVIREWIQVSLGRALSYSLLFLVPSISSIWLSLIIILMAVAAPVQSFIISRLDLDLNKN